MVGRLVGWIVLLSLRSLGRCVCALLRSCMYISMSNLLFGNVFAKAKNLCILLLGNNIARHYYTMLHLHIAIVCLHS